MLAKCANFFSKTSTMEHKLFRVQFCPPFQAMLGSVITCYSEYFFELR